jgi:hypothetical protein
LQRRPPIGERETEQDRSKTGRRAKPVVVLLSFRVSNRFRRRSELEQRFPYKTRARLQSTGRSVSRTTVIARSGPLVKSAATMEDNRERAYKFVAYSAVTFSLVAILSVCITMPMVYNFVNHVQQQTKRDLQYCKVHNSTLSPF